MRTKTTFLFIALVALGYLAALFFFGREKNFVSHFAEMGSVLPALLMASLLAYSFRGVRWLMLVYAFGHRMAVVEAFVGYVAGFAFTASPGKAGELIRIRYLGRQGVPASHVVAAFVFERALDLITLLLFATFLIGSAPGLGGAIIFVAMVLAAVVSTARWPRLRYRVQRAFRAAGLRLPARLVRIVFGGVEKAAHLVSMRSIIPAILLGTLAWGVQCIGYALALSGLGIALPWWVLFAIPPAAILIGAASMLPGGIGSTEMATVVLLVQFGSAIDVAVLASIAVRLGSIWFATLLGLVAVASLETPLFRQQTKRSGVSA